MVKISFIPLGIVDFDYAISNKRDYEWFYIVGPSTQLNYLILTIRSLQSALNYLDA